MQGNDREKTAMTKDEQKFLEILGDYICGAKTIADEETDWNAISYLAKIHQVTAIVCSQCKNYISPILKAQFNSSLAATTFEYANRKRNFDKLQIILENNKIEFFPVKGQVVLNYYRDASVRTMGDVAVVIHDYDRARLRKILDAEGYSFVEDKGDELTYSYKGSNYEFHDKLIYEKFDLQVQSHSFFNNCWEYYNPETHSVDESFHFLYVISHLQKHFLGTGVGFRQFMDVAFFAKECKNLNWDWIFQKLKEIELIDFANSTFNFCNYCFGTAIPTVYTIEDKGLFDDSLDIIMKNGVFGRDNELHDSYRTFNEISRNGKRPVWSMIKVACNLIFPSYKNLIAIEKYKFIVGRPWLLPCAWVYRLFDGLKYGKLKKELRLVKASFVSKDKLSRRKQLLTLWGMDC